MTTLDDGTTIRLLGPDEGAAVGGAIRAVYGETYDRRWVYDADEVSRRIADGRLVSCVAEDQGGSLLSHAGLSRSSPTDLVGEAGLAVTMPAARGHHLFTAVKSHLADWARAEGLCGMFSESTTAHPYSERANVDLGAHECGFLVGYPPPIGDGRPLSLGDEHLRLVRSQARSPPRQAPAGSCNELRNMPRLPGRAPRRPDASCRLIRTS